MSELKLERHNSNTAFVKGSDVLFIQSGSATSDSDSRWLLDEVITRFNNHNRLTAIATKQATRADELYEALEMCIEALERSYNATEWPADGSSQQEVTAAQCREVLDRTKIKGKDK